MKGIILLNIGTVVFFFVANWAAAKWKYRRDERQMLIRDIFYRAGI